MVWITHFRRKILLKGVKDYPKIRLLEIRKHYPDWEYLVDVVVVHVYLYMLSLLSMR